MQHLDPFSPRPVSSLQAATLDSWKLERYAIVANGRSHDEEVTEAVTQEALRRLPTASELSDGERNHGIAIQLIHFAETAVVSPVFYWKWGMVRGHIDQMRAQWVEPSQFGDGVRDLVGCIWELDIISFEIKAWKDTVLNTPASLEERISGYLRQRYIE